MATDEDPPPQAAGSILGAEGLPSFTEQSPTPLLALPPVLQEDDSVSRGADSSRWIMEIKLCVCLVIKSNALTVALSPGPPAQVVLPYL